MTADLLALARTRLDEARAQSSGRSAAQVVHEDVLRQVVVALARGRRLSEHAAPAAATVQVLVGSLRIEFEDREPVTLSAGELAALEQRRHSVTALEDAAFLLTTVAGPDPATQPHLAG